MDDSDSKRLGGMRAGAFMEAVENIAQFAESCDPLARPAHGHGLVHVGPGHAALGPELLPGHDDLDGRPSADVLQRREHERGVQAAHVHVQVHLHAP